MKITKQQLINIIKEELEQVTSEGRYRQATTEPELYDALKDAIGNRSEYMVMGVLRGVLVRRTTGTTSTTRPRRRRQKRKKKDVEIIVTSHEGTLPAWLG